MQNMRTVPKPDPGKNREMIKILNTKNEFNSFIEQQFHHATDAYVHVPVILNWQSLHFLFNYRRL
jgi:hypothetical protein